MSATDTYIVYDPCDPWHAARCIGDKEVRNAGRLFSVPFSMLRIQRVTDGELSRDVSADFITDPAHDGFDEHRSGRARFWSVGDYQHAASRR